MEIFLHSFLKNWFLEFSILTAYILANFAPRKLVKASFDEKFYLLLRTRHNPISAKWDLFICTYTMYMYKNVQHRLQFWIDFNEIHMVGAGSIMGETLLFLETIGPVEQLMSGKMWLYSASMGEPHFLQKRLYWFLSPHSPFPSKGSILSQIVFRSFFPKILLLLKNLINNKISDT